MTNNEDQPLSSNEFDEFGNDFTFDDETALTDFEDKSENPEKENVRDLYADNPSSRNTYEDATSLSEEHASNNDLEEDQMEPLIDLPEEEKETKVQNPHTNDWTSFSTDFTAEPPPYNEEEEQEEVLNEIIEQKSNAEPHKPETPSSTNIFEQEDDELDKLLDLDDEDAPTSDPTFGEEALLKQEEPHSTTVHETAEITKETASFTQEQPSALLESFITDAKLAILTTPLALQLLEQPDFIDKDLLALNTLLKSEYDTDPALGQQLQIGILMLLQNPLLSMETLKNPTKLIHKLKSLF